MVDSAVLPATAAKAVKQRFPGREAEVDQLAEVLGCSAGQAAPCLVYGPGATGKTTVVRCALPAGAPPSAARQGTHP